MLREVLRLVAERADAEAKLASERTLSRTSAEPNTKRTRRALIEKLQGLETEANAADEKRRRAIVDAALDGEAQGEGGIRRSQPQGRHAVRCRARFGQERVSAGQGRRRGPVRFQPAEGRQGTCRENQADRRQCPDGRRLSRAAGHSRGRLQEVQTQSRGARADSRVVRPVQRSRRRAFHPACSHGAPAQAARDADHSQGDEGAPRALGFRVCDRAAGGPRPASWAWICTA